MPTNFLYDGDRLVGEYDGAGNLLRRYVHGPDTDEPLVVYENGTKQWLYGDRQGSVVALADAAGNSTALMAYGAFGEPSRTMAGRFAYTGQARIPEIGLYYYKARMYSPMIGRFMQTDPIGYGDGMNWYAYVGNDPVNNSDPSGLGTCYPSDAQCDVIIVTGGSNTPSSPSSINTGGSSGNGSQYFGGLGRGWSAPPSLGATIPRYPTTSLAPAAQPPQNWRNTLANALDDFAEDYLKPPEGRQEGESYSDCVSRISSLGRALAGTAAVEAGRANKSLYPRTGFGGGGQGTSYISRATRYLFRRFGWNAPLGRQVLGTGTRAGLTGRVLSSLSGYGGAAIGGLEVGKALGANQRCK